MDLTFILAGLVGVAIGIGDYFRGKSSFFFFNVGFLNNWDGMIIHCYFGLAY